MLERLMATTSDYGLGEFTFPRGWFMVADAARVSGAPQAVRFFGQELVLYRGQASGQVVLLDAYCPHMGTHLARNSTSFVVRNGQQIEGDTIRCPFHRWRFGSDGRCVEIPYAAAPIPAAARIRSWRVVERMGAVFAWHDPEGGEPDWQIPTLDEWNDSAWVHWTFDDLGVLKCHPQEVVDNIVDAAHQLPVHGQDLIYFENEFRGHRVLQREGGVSSTALSASRELLTIDAAYHGPGVLISSLGGRYPSYFMICHTPVDDGSIQVWHALLMKSAHGIATADDVATARAFQALSLEAFAQDFDLWLNKRPATQILQIVDDGPYHKLRQWYRQFYNPRARVAEITRGVDGLYGIRGFPRTLEEARRSGSAGQ
jgi:3-ketosteroid 9alpha-monooxygenase subunit A